MRSRLGLVVLGPTLVLAVVLAVAACGGKKDSSIPTAIDSFSTSRR